jgi:hypothetical protein
LIIVIIRLIGLALRVLSAAPWLEFMGRVPAGLVIKVPLARFGSDGPIAALIILEQFAVELWPAVGGLGI